MFFTQTIRRKLGVGLGIIFFMLILLAYGAVSGSVPQLVSAGSHTALEVAAARKKGHYIKITLKSTLH